MKKNKDNEAILTENATPVATEAVQPATEPVQNEPRIREKGSEVKCPDCGKDAFAVGTRTHPAFIERRIRRYKCGACGTNFKQLA